LTLRERSERGDIGIGEPSVECDLEDLAVEW
jgi:hypothetical protein